MNNNNISNPESEALAYNPLRTHVETTSYVESLLQRVIGYKSNTHAILADRQNSVYCEQHARFRLLYFLFVWIDQENNRHSITWHSNPDIPQSETQHVLMFDNRGGEGKDKIRYVLYKGLEAKEILACGSTDKYSNLVAIVDNPGRNYDGEPFLVAFTFLRKDNESIRSRLLKGQNGSVVDYVMIAGEGSAL